MVFNPIWSIISYLFGRYFRRPRIRFQLFLDIALRLMYFHIRIVRNLPAGESHVNIFDEVTEQEA